MKKNFTNQLFNGIGSMSAALQYGLMIAMLLLMAVLNAHSQTINPVRYWTFNGANATIDSMGVSNLNFTTYGSQYTVSPNGQVGKYITLDGNSNLIEGGAMNLSNAVTLEFLFKPGYKFHSTNLMQRGDGAFSIRIEYAMLTFSTSHKSSTGATIEDNFVISLEGLGRKSYGYYTDNNWHHLVFRFDAAAGTKQVWVDGQLPAGFSKTLIPGTFQNSGNINFYLNHSINYVKYFGSIDELAIYNTAIPASLIYKHYLGIQTGQPYSFLNNYAGNIPAPANVTGPMDPLEFAPGHPSVNISAIEQLSKYPVPRFKPGNTLIKNFNWMDPKFMGGAFQPGVTTQQAAVNSAIIQTELARNFNYFFQVGLGNGPFETEWTNAANANPDFKLSMILLRGQLNGSNCELLNQSKTSTHYLQNSSGQFIDANGNVTASKIWRPTAPTSSYNGDGNMTLQLMNDMFSRLNRNVDMVNENGEIFPHPTDAALAKDPVVLSAKNASGLDWKSFLARKFNENETMSYRNIFMTHPRLAGAKFTEYAIDGFPEYRMKYSEARTINTPINGQYYATPDFYPRWSNNWRNWVSAWHGWQWIVESRVNELALGDRLYSPFVAAGWDVDEEKNIRPAQWLGLLKCLGMTGAEFYYPGFFSLAAPWPDSKNWIWQAAMPSYAQAITSRYEDFLRNGELMDGDVGNSYVTPTAPGYSFWTGDLRKLVVIRKHNTYNKFAITGTIQPNSSMIGNTENESVATITLEGQTLKFKVKRQGSTYIYDKTNPAAPVFYQLDGWHEQTHPSHWSNDFQLESELFDNNNTQVAIKTSVPAGTASGDFTNFTSYVAWPDNAVNPQPLEYNFTPRSIYNNDLYVWVRARSRGGVPTSMNIQVDNTTAKSIGCISDTAWTWYRFDACTQQVIRYPGLSFQNHIFRITPGNDKLEIDKVLLTANASLILNAAPPSCGAATATITASGATTFCFGGSVTLTASSGTSYLWSPNGQTTQTINVTAPGTYNVTVGSGGACSAIATPVAITVLQAPVAQITPSATTSFCQGGSVTLTASTGSSYLWIPGGQTTQSIPVTSSGNYSVKVTNAGGCTATSSPTTVTVFANPTASISASGPTVLLPGETVTLTASGGSSYIWSPGGQTTSSIVVNAAGTYTVTAINASGCTAISAPVEVTLTTIPNPPAIITASNGSGELCPGNFMTLTASAGGSFLWSPGGQTTQSINVSSAGTYTVDVTDVTGTFTNTASIDVAYKPAPDAPAILSTFIPGSTFQLIAYEPTAHTYLWSTGSTSSSVTISTTGTYTVRAVNGVGCKSAPQNVTVNSMTAQNCAAPDMLSHYGITKNDAILSWNPAVTADSFRVEYTRISTNTNYSVTVPGSTSQVSIDNLIAGETYKWTTNAICGGNQFGSINKQFTTLNGPLPCGSTPQNLSNDVVNSTMARVSWFDTQADKFVIRYRAVGTTTYLFRRSMNTLTTGLIEGLTPSTSYEWSVRSVCGGSVSLYSQPKYFTTPAACPAVGPWSVSEIGFNKALVTWTPVTSADSVMIRYGVEGSNVYKHIKIAANPDPGQYWIMGILPQTTYRVWVATKCVIGSTSMWGSGSTFTTFSDPNLRFTTEAGAIHLNAFPNPTKYQIGYVFESDDEKPYTVKVCDMAGRELLSEVRNANEGKTGDEVALAGFSGGLYMLIIQKGGQVGRFKFNIHE